MHSDELASLAEGEERDADHRSGAGARNSPPRARRWLRSGVDDLIGPVDLALWEPEYGRLAEAQVRWEAEHGRPLAAVTTRSSAACGGGDIGPTSPRSSGHASPIPGARNRSPALVDSPPAIFLVAAFSSDEGIAGYIVAFSVGEEAEIANVAVDPQSRGKGIGGADARCGADSTGLAGVRTRFSRCGSRTPRRCPVQVARVQRDRAKVEVLPAAGRRCVGASEDSSRPSKVMRRKKRAVLLTC